jgi:hypothetical protein
MRCLLRAAEALADRRLLLRLRLLRLVRLVLVRRELLGQALGADRLALLELLERPLEFHLLAMARPEEAAEHPRRRRHRACSVPSSL